MPVVLVTGDDLTCEDAKGYAPEARTVAVKDYVSRYAAVCRPPARTAADIRGGRARGRRAGACATSPRAAARSPSRWSSTPST